MVLIGAARKRVVDSWERTIAPDTQCSNHFLERRSYETYLMSNAVTRGWTYVSMSKKAHTKRLGRWIEGRTCM